MGVTIHYEGQVRDQASYEQVMAFAETFATRQAWKTEPVRSEGTAPDLDDIMHVLALKMGKQRAA